MWIVAGARMSVVRDDSELHGPLRSSAGSQTHVSCVSSDSPIGSCVLGITISFDYESKLRLINVSFRAISCERPSVSSSRRRPGLRHASGRFTTEGAHFRSARPSTLACPLRSVTVVPNGSVACDAAAPHQNPLLVDRCVENRDVELRVVEPRTPKRRKPPRVSPGGLRDA